jgi:SAM-dependent methyltransferase
MQYTETNSRLKMSRKNYLLSYIEKAPIPLAIERYYECEIFLRQKIKRPILDIGCGDGLFASVFFDDQVDLGIDPDIKEIERAKGENIYYDLKNCYASDIPRSDKSFMTIFSNSVLEHIEHLNPVLTEIHRLLDDNGHVYVTVPTNYFDKYSISYRFLSLFNKSLGEKFKKFFNDFWRHHHYYDVDGWMKLFEEHNLKTVMYRTYGSSRSCHINNILNIFSAPSTLTRKFYHRWFLFPRFRKKISPVLARIISGFVVKDEMSKKIEQGGLVFFYLQKK